MKFIGYCGFYLVGTTPVQKSYVWYGSEQDKIVLSDGHWIKLKYLPSLVWHMDFTQPSVLWNPCVKTNDILQVDVLLLVSCKNLMSVLGILVF